MISHGEARSGVSDGHGESRIPVPMPPTLVPALGGLSGAHGERIDGGGAVAGTGPWVPSIQNDPRPFSQGGVCFNGGEGEVGGAILLGSYVAVRTKDQPNGSELGVGGHL